MASRLRRFGKLTVEAAWIAFVAISVGLLFAFAIGGITYLVVK